MIAAKIGTMLGFGKRNIERWLTRAGVEFLRDLGVGEGHTVLDFGCGIGSITIPAARAVGRRGRVIALDVKEGQLNHIRKKVTGTGLEHRIDFVKTSGAPEFPGVAEDSLDAVFVFDVLQHVEDWDGLFGQCGTALKANGRLHINASELSHPGRVDIQAMQQILEKRGFREAGRLQTRLMHYKHMTDDVVRSYE